MFDIKDIPPDFNRINPKRASKFGITAADLPLHELTPGKSITIPATMDAAFQVVRTYVYNFNKENGAEIRASKRPDGTLLIYLAHDAAPTEFVGRANKPISNEFKSFLDDPANFIVATTPNYDQFAGYVRAMTATLTYQLGPDTTPIETIKEWCERLPVSCKELSPGVLTIVPNPKSFNEDE